MTLSKNKAQAERENQLQDTIQSLKTTIASEKEAKKKEEQTKRTPPIITLWLTMTDTPNPDLRRFTLYMKPLNPIPFEFDWLLTTKDGIMLVASITIEWGRIFPTPNADNYYDSKEMPINKVKDNYIELVFKYRSIYMKELNLPELRGERKLQFQLSEDKHSLLPIQHSQ